MATSEFATHPDMRLRLHVSLLLVIRDVRDGLWLLASKLSTIIIDVSFIIQILTIDVVVLLLLGLQVCVHHADLFAMHFPVLLPVNCDDLRGVQLVGVRTIV